MHSQLLPTIAPPPEAIEEGVLGAEKGKGINLDLGIGRSSCCRYEKHVKREQEDEEEEEEEALFSPSQFHELLNQILVYNWIISGHRNQSVGMDSEPGRCRRTDGRKWRCSRSVIPGHKYCERHVNRGRQGSRKHVEPSERANKIPDYNPTAMVPSPINNEARYAETRRDNGNGVPTIVNSTLIVKEVGKTDNRDHATSSTKDGTNAMKSGFGNANSTKISRRKQSVTKNNHHGFVSPGLGLSPKSVLHSSAGKVYQSLESKSSEEPTEQQRCRRTDGKKWQCRRDSVAGQKYCEAHMHRGAKRVMLNQEPANNVPTTSTRSACVPETSEGQHRINLNNVPTSPQHTPGDNSTSSTSDATTVTDENISFCLKG